MAWRRCSCSGHFTVIICTDTSLIHHYTWICNEYHFTEPSFIYSGKVIQSFFETSNLFARQPFPIITHLIIFRNNLKIFCDFFFVFCSQFHLMNSCSDQCTGVLVAPTTGTCDDSVFVILISPENVAFDFPHQRDDFWCFYSVICE